MNTQKITFGIISATLVNWLLGALWYSPFVMGERWATLTHVALPTEFAVGPILGALVCALVMSLIMTCFMYRMRIHTLLSGFHFGWMSWLGFIAPTTINYVLFEQRSIELVLINNGFSLVAITAMAMILAYALKNEHNR